MSYKIKLPVFEGPFDLLLYLIKKNEVDIYNIPIAEITHQYLEYLDFMKMLDLDIAGEFIEMVATLMLIKVRMLLPGDQGQADEEYQDPRSQLVAQLLEYKKFKDASLNFAAMETERRKYFSRGKISELSTESSSETEDYLEDASLFDLLTAFKVALDNMPKVTVHEVSVIKVTLEKQVEYIFNQFEDRSYSLFREICQPIKTKMEMIVTFMAVLDLIRLQFLAAKQSDIFGEIRLVVLQSLSMEKYLDIRDQELLPELVNNDQNSK
jgi:segregation and condensation protein A